MASFTPKKFIDLDGLTAFRDLHDTAIEKVIDAKIANIDISAEIADINTAIENAVTTANAYSDEKNEELANSLEQTIEGVGQQFTDLNNAFNQHKTSNETSFSDVNTLITNHTTASNPHGITPEKIGAAEATHSHAISQVGGLSDRLTTIESNATTLSSTVSTLSSNFDTHTASKENPHAVTKAQVGLGNVDNTSDANKPVSTATQNALNLKADKTALEALSTTVNGNQSAVDSALAAKADLVNGTVPAEQLLVATMDDINALIAEANIAYTETALNIALDELNGEVV